MAINNLESKTLDELRILWEKADNHGGNAEGYPQGQIAQAIAAKSKEPTPVIKPQTESVEEYFKRIGFKKEGR